ncbi:MAG TPA: ATP-grasp domain-containing protein, partial [Thermoanaerobaculia bacterium]|nr:ATP-grasp domain-containing protein [Thermoanaerobaculia bacterium]
ARSAGIPVPATYRAELSTNGETLNASVAFPAIVKPQIGNSAKGVFIVSSPAECSEKIGFLRSRYGLDGDRGPIVQEYVEGPGYGVCVLFCHGELRAAFCERYLLSKEGRLGTSVLRESVERPDLVEHARTLLEPLGWHGVAHLDFIHDEERDRQVLIEVNPRFWGALDLAVAAGVDFPWLLYRMALEGDVDLVTEYRLGVRSRWLVGELIHLVHAARMEGLSGIGSAFWGMLRRRAQSHDDFRWSDPVPLFAEMLYYGRRFARSGSTNPIDVGMIG